MQTHRIAILGLGTVGAGVYQVLTRQREAIRHREGVDAQIAHILVRSRKTSRNLDLAPSDLYTEAYEDILNDAGVSVIVECMGGVEPARTYILQALARGITVVTSNKEVVAKHWPAFDAAARKTGAGLYIEATACGGIPVVRAITESMQANELTRAMGIVNGTTNYILTSMTDGSVSFADALAQAQRLGYAEADPTADVEGFDTAYKLSILSSLALHAHVPVEHIYREGITGLTAADFAAARALDCRIKLLAIAKKCGARLEARVHPTLLPAAHPLAQVDGVFNAFQMTGDAVGDVTLIGRGAGSLPTASAVVSDVLTACAHMGRHRQLTFVNEAELAPGLTCETDFSAGRCIRAAFGADGDAPGRAAKALAANGLRVARTARIGAENVYAFLTEAAPESTARAALHALNVLPCISGACAMLRTEE